MQFAKLCFYEIRVIGVNFPTLLNKLNSQGVKITKMRHPDDTTICLVINGKYADTTFAILQKFCYNYTVTHKIGLNSHYLGLFLGVLGVIIAYLVLSCFCFGIAVMSDDEVLAGKIESVLYDEGVVGATWGKIDFDRLENVLREKVDGVGLINLSKRGAYIVVNFTATTPPLEIPSTNTSGVFANANGVVSRIFVHSGTALVVAGDTVSLGDMLIAPYVVDEEGNTYPAEARGEVYLEVWDSATVEFRENDTVLSRTGNVTTFQKVCFGTTVLSDNSGEISYENYEIVRKIVNLSNILPLFIEYAYIYETTPVSITRDFEAEKEALIYEARERVLSNIREDEVLAERHTINQIQDTYFVTYYVMREVRV